MSTQSEVHQNLLVIGRRLGQLAYLRLRKKDATLRAFDLICRFGFYLSSQMYLPAVEADLVHVQILILALVACRWEMHNAY